VPSSVSSRTLLGVALLAGSLLMTELSLTRIFSVTMYYHFAFMAISIALFGLSASGVYVFLMRERWKDVSTERLLSTHAFAYTIGTAIALFVLVRMRVGLTYTPSNIALMSVVYFLSAVPFFLGGATISLAISRLSSNINAVYAADLLGAGAGCLLLMPALNILGAPNAIVMSALMGAVAGALMGRGGISPRWRALMGCVLPLVIVSALFGNFDVSTTKGHEGHPVLFSKWNSFSRIGVYEQPYGAWSLSERYTGPLPDSRLMDIDSAAGTQILKFGGNLKDVSYLQYELTALGYRLYGTPDAPPRAPFDALVIGTGAADGICCPRSYSAHRRSTASRSIRSS
jgi:hypothetical protein